MVSCLLLVLFCMYSQVKFYHFNIRLPSKAGREKKKEGETAFNDSILTQLRESALIVSFHLHLTQQEINKYDYKNDPCLNICVYS